MINCTVAKNHVQGLGGGIGFQTTNADGMTATVANCIAWNNTCREDDYGTGNANIRFGNPQTDGKLPERVTIGAISVSYTHLDVYKRQILRGVALILKAG